MFDMLVLTWRIQMKILVAEDHVLFREALSSMLKQIDGKNEIIETATYAETNTELENNKNFDLIVIDMALPDNTWEKGLSLIKDKNKKAKIVVLSATEDSRIIKKAAERGITAYIPKSLNPKIMQGIMKVIFAGGTYIPVSALSSAGSPKTAHALTRRQNEVLNLVAEGKSNKQIAYEIGVSEATVKLHINALLRALGVTNRTQAVITAQKQGIL